MNQTWWNENLSNPETMQLFESWIGKEDAISKKIIRNHVISKKYKSILDVGCGLASEYDGYKNIEKYNIDYTGIDSCKILIDKNRERGINMIEANCEDIPLNNSSIDVVFSRHVLEHQPSFKGTLSEMIRVARKEAIHIFFIKPNDTEIIKYTEHDNLYHNTYCKKDIEEFISSNNKVKKFYWKEINETECSLHILV